MTFADKTRKELLHKLAWSLGTTFHRPYSSQTLLMLLADELVSALETGDYDNLLWPVPVQSSRKPTSN